MPVSMFYGASGPDPCHSLVCDAGLWWINGPGLHMAALQRRLGTRDGAGARKVNNGKLKENTP
jgi:hypothetical protein